MVYPSLSRSYASLGTRSINKSTPLRSGIYIYVFLCVVVVFFFLPSARQRLVDLCGSPNPFFSLSFREDLCSSHLFHVTGEGSGGIVMQILGIYMLIKG